MAVSIHWGWVKPIMGHKYTGILTAVKGTEDVLEVLTEKDLQDILFWRKEEPWALMPTFVCLSLRTVSERIHSKSAPAAAVFREAKWSAEKGGSLL